MVDTINETNMLKRIQKEILSYADPKKAIILQKFFKTGKGGYGEGDRFLGITVPTQRSIAKKYKDIPLSDISKLMSGAFHEHRLIALLILIEQSKRANEEARKLLVNFYLKNTNHIDNWDLVDLSAHQIVGKYLLKKDKKILYKLAKSKNIWERRIAIISCFEFIKAQLFNDTLKIAEILLYDKHDLIQKAVGWMLREIGKRDQNQEEIFLKKYYLKMPRTMLRYAIERFPEEKRQAFLKGRVKANE